jgi:molecular chaperone GrpE (heat shock protein)
MKVKLKEFSKQAQNWHAKELQKQRDAKEKAQEANEKAHEKAVEGVAGTFVGLVDAPDKAALALPEALTGDEVTHPPVLIRPPLVVTHPPGLPTPVL